MPKILVTGATGFVGYHVAKKLMQKGLGEVLCLTRPASEKRHLNNLGVRMVEGDLRDVPSLERALKGCEILFHVAADYRLWSKNPQELVESNVQGTRNILQAAEREGIKKIVYTSSVSAVGRPEVHWSPAEGMDRAEWENQFSGDESLDPAPSQLIGPYKQSKFLAEVEVRGFVKKGLPVVVVNPSTPVGSHDVKPTPTGKMILDFLKSKMPAYLDTGLNLVDVDDVAEGHLLALEKGKAGERYILGNKNLMLKEILEMLSKLTGLPFPKFKIPYWIAFAAGMGSTALAELTGRPPEVPLDGVRMAKEIMFYKTEKCVKDLRMPQSSIEGALHKAVRFFKDSGYLK